MLAVWAVCLVWVVSASYLLAPDEEALRIASRAGVGARAPDGALWGLPRWIVWGVAVPWAISTLLTVGIAVFAIRDDDLGTDMDAGPTAIPHDADGTRC